MTAFVSNMAGHRPKKGCRMTRHDDHNASGPQHTPRLRLKPKAPTSGHVDGAWWPYSTDLPSELPDLLAVLSVRLGTIGRVTYKLAEWPNAPRRFTTDGRTVRLAGYNLQPDNTLQVSGLGGENLLLLVVPPSTAPDVAHEAMMAAAAPRNASTVGDLLACGASASGAGDDDHRSTFRRRLRGART
jgi:hypothetical protein